MRKLFEVYLDREKQYHVFQMVADIGYKITMITN